MAAIFGMDVNDGPSLEEGRRLDRRTQPRDQPGESSEGSKLRWREAGDTEGEIEGWRNTQQGYGSFRQTRGQFFGEGERVISEHTVGGVSRSGNLL